MTSILLTGATGLLGPVVWRHLVDQGRVTGVARNREDETLLCCDLTDRDATAELLDKERPDAIVHLAALADVDRCEAAPDEAYRLNVVATRNLVEQCLERRLKTQFVYISTDQVYDAPGPSAENAVQPRNVYALTKLWGEDHVRRLARHLVLRVNFFAGTATGGKGLLPWFSERARSGGQVTLFTDILFNPLHVEHLSALIAEMLEGEISGTYNLGSSGEGLSKAAFLRMAAECLGLPDIAFTEGSVVDAGLRAYRPRDMRMLTEKAAEALGHGLPTTKAGLDLLSGESGRDAGAVRHAD